MSFFHVADLIKTFNISRASAMGYLQDFGYTEAKRQIIADQLAYVQAIEQGLHLWID